MEEALKSVALDEYDETGLTLLLAAIFIGDPALVKTLLDAGADPNIPQRDDPTATPLWHAEEDFGFVEIDKILRQCGAKEFNPSLHTDANGRG